MTFGSQKQCETYFGESTLIGGNLRLTVFPGDQKYESFLKLSEDNGRGAVLPLNVTNDFMTLSLEIKWDSENANVSFSILS